MNEFQNDTVRIERILWKGERLLALKFTRHQTSRYYLLPEFPLKAGYAKAEELIRDEFCPEPDDQRNVQTRCLTFLMDRSPALLKVTVEERPDTDVIRFRYTLEGEDIFRGLDGETPIRYGGLITGTGQSILTEIQLSQFDRILHSFVPSSVKDTMEAFEGREVCGPILMSEDDAGTVLLAYEHGAEAPDHFLAWYPEKDILRLGSVKGNYYGGQPAGEYASPWIEAGFSDTPEKMLREYRRFVLEDLAAFGDSRKPYVFYNTWHFQEGNTYFRGDSYLKYMKEDYILKDIEIAHRMGVEVYVIDTGWFRKTGDWEVNDVFFPNGLETIRNRLEEYGMRLGLWFNPIAAARTSRMYREHPECVMSLDGEETFWGKIWETEESYGMCLASDYSDMFIEQLVMLNRTLGVSYFKWDAVGQYGCDSPDHGHGTAENSREERLDCYAYRMGLEMIRIASEVSRRCAGAIVDFDVTEGGRFVGLGFLSAGKYFLMNNGPYFHNFDIPETVHMEPDTINVFFYPGAARPQICRQSAGYDPYVPSVLFLTHFFPHGGKTGQLNSMASLTLGGNGIWGFLQQMTEEDICRWAEFLKKYKRVREDVTRSYPRLTGNPGGSPEIHEKLDRQTGRGIVVFFTHGGGRFTYMTGPLAKTPASIDGADEYRITESGRVSLTVKLDEDEARVVFFDSDESNQEEMKHAD